MPQSTPVTTAGFGAWLKEKRLATDRQIPHLIRWTERFLRLWRQRPTEPWRDLLRVFLEDLDSGYTPDWQIRQAADAVSLFWGQFRPSRASGAGNIPESSGRPSSAAHTLYELHRLLRLRHYSPSTVKAYTGWAQRYLRYLGGRRTSLPTTADAQAYLSYLATRANVSASPRTRLSTPCSSCTVMSSVRTSATCPPPCARIAARSFPWCSPPMRCAASLVRSRAGPASCSNWSSAAACA